MGFIERNDCLVCNDNKHETLYSSPLNEGPLFDFIYNFYHQKPEKEQLASGRYHILQCKKCRLVWQKDIPDGSLMKELYEIWIDSDRSLKKRREAKIHLYSDYARQIQWIAHFIPERPHNVRVLDYGSGWGYWLMMAKAHGYDAKGLEMAENKVSFCNSNGLEIIRDLSEQEDESLDFINSEQVLEHVPAPGHALRDLAAKLKKGGVIRVSVPDGCSYHKALLQKGLNFKEMGVIHPLEHINCFNHDNLLYLGKKSGLQPIEKMPVLKYPSRLKNLYKNSYFRYSYSRQFKSTTIYFRKI